MTEYSSEYLALMKEGNERGHVYVIGGFGMEMSDHVPGQLKLAVESARKLNKNYVLFFIDSSGGLFSTFQTYMSAIQMFKPKDFLFVGYVAGQCSSAACDLLQYMDWRVAHAHATLLIHYGTSKLTNWDQAMLQQNAAEALPYERSRNAVFLEMYRKRSGNKLTTADIHRISMTDTSFTAQQALAWGVIDEIVETLPAQSVRPDYTL